VRRVTRRTADDAAGRALTALVDEIGLVIAELERARERAGELQVERRQGRSWYEIVSDEDRPLIVEQISGAMASLSRAGSRWRRAQAHALHDEHISINRIAELYGVTRQRVSALLKGQEEVPPGP
jgi:hypothetical protein